VSLEPRIPEPLSDLMKRCENGRTASLLTPADKDSCTGIGTYQVMVDLLTLGFLLLGLHQLPGLDQTLLPATAMGLLNSFVSGMDTFAPFAFTAVFLSIQTRKVSHQGKIGE